MENNLSKSYWLPNTTNYMIDFETLDTTPTALILSLGICRFDKHGPDDKFYVEFNRHQSDRTVSEATIVWWTAQGNIPTGATDLDYGIRDALVFMDSHRYNPGDSIEVWAKGTDFDIVIFNNILQQLKLKPVWRYNAVSDMRTLKKYNSDIILPYVNLNSHNALEDAMYQAYTTMHILNCLDRRAGHDN